MGHITKVKEMLADEKKIKMEPIPKHSDLMTLEEFIDNVECGWFIDYDGFGYYSNGTEMVSRGPDTPVRPSHVKKGLINKSYSHIVWFNR